ncbi:Dabb family protein [Cellulophaga baltica]|uniref:Stress responsive protein n=2 Tax=Cellulophaga baltica TaxID=76594 RepID=A0AAU8RD59_9FLAO|nr:Dabb family protein [Cellulophaga baltica]AIY13024.1 stress responsive protein [Cellulophaga baltica NN016038]AIZ41391.1 stress responsive protein [Cellulophaga baltica 18]MCR1023596.1 Dabb family protein [Cellulophaga baltica]
MKLKHTFALSIFLVFSFFTHAQTATTMDTFDSNFAHTVFFWLNNPDSQEDCKAFETSLRKFLDHSEYAKTKFIGKPPRASREVVDGSFTYSLIVTFESAEAQEAYQKEAPHLVFIEESSALWNKVIVYDSKDASL